MRNLEKLVKSTNQVWKILKIWRQQGYKFPETEILAVWEWRSRRSPEVTDPGPPRQPHRPSLPSSLPFGMMIWVCLKMLCTPKPNGWRSLSLWKMAISLGVYPIFRQTHLSWSIKSSRNCGTAGTKNLITISSLHQFLLTSVAGGYPKPQVAEGLVGPVRPRSFPGTVTHQRLEVYQPDSIPVIHHWCHYIPYQSHLISRHLGKDDLKTHIATPMYDW